MFYVHGIFSTNGMKIKEIEAYWRFWFSKVLRFQHITLIQEIPATT
jgi:hypothetical protein